MNYFNYFTEIEDTFVRRRGKNLFLSPLDWAMIEAWQDRGIPLHVVIRSIESVFDVFDKQPPGTRSIKSLFYCREEVEAQYSEWLTSQTGKPDAAVSDETEFTVEGISAHIDDVSAKLRNVNNAAITEDIARAVDRLNEIRTALTSDLEAVDGSLSDVEKLLERALLQKTDLEHLKVIERDISTQLKSYKAEMDADKYRDMFERMLVKRLRDDAGIPRLGLYFL